MDSSLILEIIIFLIEFVIRLNEMAENIFSFLTKQRGTRWSIFFNVFWILYLNTSFLTVVRIPIVLYACYCIPKKGTAKEYDFI